MESARPERTSANISGGQVSRYQSVVSATVLKETFVCCSFLLSLLQRLEAQRSSAMRSSIQRAQRRATVERMERNGCSVANSEFQIKRPIPLHTLDVCVWFLPGLY